VSDLVWHGPQRVTITGSANVSNFRATFNIRGTSSITYNETPTVATLAAHGVTVTPGTVGVISQDLATFENSVATVTGGKLDRLTAGDHSVVTVTGGELSSLVPDHYSAVTMTGGQVGMLETRAASATDVWGGKVVTVRASNGTLTIHGMDFSLGSGLSLSGDKLLGQGVLGGKWLDGTPWSMDILSNNSAADILLVPEPASLLVMMAAGLPAVLKRRRCRS